MAMTLVHWLEARQQEMGMSNRAFAAFLGISDSYWTLLRNNKRNAGRALLMRSAKAFPEHGEAIGASAIVENEPELVA